VKVDVHDRLDAVGAAAWDELHARSASRAPFLGFTWQVEWARAFLDGRRLEVWRVTDDGGPIVALLPLFEATPGVMRLVGGTDVSDYLDLLAAAGREVEAWEALLEARAGRAPRWDLHDVPAASPTVRTLPALAPAFGFTASVILEERCPVVDLPATWDAYLAALSGKDRHELNRKLRRIAREVPEARATCLPTRAHIEARLPEFIDLHRRSRQGKARFMDARMEEFFRRVAAALADRAAARLWFLDTADGPLAGFLTLEWDGTVGLYNSGFRPDRAALSPGLVLLAHMIRDAIERRVRRFDFLRGEERYKYDLGARPEDVHTVVIARAGAGE
jgi:CelD/BcsL family acetyltransferase involved in cellulose biosynthesis